MTTTFIPVPLCAKVNMVYSNQGELAENVYNVVGAAPWSISSMILLADAFAQAETEILKATRHPSTQFVKVAVTDLSSQSAPGIEHVLAVPLGGTHAGIPVPQSVTMAVKWSTALRGRSFRGRTYHVGVCLEDQDSGVIKSNWMITLTAAYNALLAFALPNSGHMVVVSRWSNHFQRPEGLCTPITAASMDNHIDTQRRRLPGRGN